MAYGVFLASVPPNEVTRFISDRSRLPVPRVICSISHLAAYWIKVQPLGSVLSEAIDGGDELSPALWHPLRSPRYHAPPTIESLLRRLTAARKLALTTSPNRDLSSFELDINGVIETFRYAAEHQHGVISALEYPSDAERAIRVIIPLAGIPAFQVGSQNS